MYDDSHIFAFPNRALEWMSGIPIAGPNRSVHFPGSEAHPENAFEDDNLLTGRPPRQTERKPVILVAVDLSPISWDAVQAGLKIAQQARGEMILLHAIHLNLTPYGPANLASLTSALREEAMEQLKALWLRAAPSTTEATCLVEAGAEAKTILQTAERCGADLIVLGSHRHGFIHRLFGQRTVQKVIEGSECPVLVVEKNLKDFLHQSRTNCVAGRPMDDAIYRQRSHERD